jgi:hypothetical protein
MGTSGQLDAGMQADTSIADIAPISALRAANYREGGKVPLDCKAGDDYLKCGSGSDTYQFSGNIGNDNLLDSDVQSQLELDGVVRTGGKGNWLCADSKVNYTLLIIHADSFNGNAPQVVGGYLKQENHDEIGKDLRVDGGGRNTFDAVEPL